MKVSLYLRDDTWSKFKRNVLHRTGDLRTLSSEVQMLLEDNSVEDSLRTGFGKMKIDTKPISSSKIVPIKPLVATSSASTLRKMKEDRFGKAVSR